MRISDWSSDVCSSDLLNRPAEQPLAQPARILQPDAAIAQVPVPLGHQVLVGRIVQVDAFVIGEEELCPPHRIVSAGKLAQPHLLRSGRDRGPIHRSEEHTSELQSLMRISYAVFCLKK